MNVANTRRLRAHINSLAPEEINMTRSRIGPYGACIANA